jgi:hypothetical protein
MRGVYMYMTGFRISALVLVLLSHTYFLWRVRIDFCWADELSYLTFFLLLFDHT